MAFEKKEYTYYKLIVTSYIQINTKTGTRTHVKTHEKNLLSEMIKKIFKQITYKLEENCSYELVNKCVMT